MMIPQVVAHRGSSAMHAENSWAAFEAEECESELRALVALRPDATCTNTPATLRRIVDRHATRTTTQESAANDC